MARRPQKKRWSYRTGEKGVNRVRAFEHPATGKLYLEYYDQGRRLTEPLPQPDRAVAKAQADRLATALRSQMPGRETLVTVRQLFDNYVREVTPQKSPGKAAHDRRTVRWAVQVLGGERLVSSLTHRDAAQLIAERRRLGDRRPGRTMGNPIGPRQLAYDLSLVRAVFNWGVGAGLLDRNPWQGFKPDLGKYTPRRPVLTALEYEALLAVADRVAPSFGLALVLAYETGHRIGAIRRLRWSDIDLERGMIRWRAEHDKIGLEHETPLTPVALAALKQARRDEPGVGEQWLFLAPRSAEGCVSRFVVGAWWRRAERLAQLPRQPGRGWHSCRRTFATEMKSAPLKDLCALGGWKDPQTILKCYQHPDLATMRRAQAQRMRLEA